MNKELLLKLADVLDKVPGHMWDFSTWVDGPGDLADPACGTTACALGWATVMPEFRDLGLRLVWSGLSMQMVPHMIGSPYAPDWASAKEASRDLFETTAREFEAMFIPDADREDDDEESFGHSQLGPNASAKDVADHIRKVARGEIEV